MKRLSQTLRRVFFCAASFACPEPTRLAGLDQRGLWRLCVPRFFFDLRLNGERMERDDVGIDLPDFETAYLEAHRAAVEMWADARRQGNKPTQVGFEVRDALGTLVLELPFTEALGLPPGPLQLRKVESDRRERAAITADVDQAEAGLGWADKCVADQRARVHRLEQKGHDTTLAKSVLATFVEAQMLRQRYYDQLRRHLR